MDEAYETLRNYPTFDRGFSDWHGCVPRGARQRWRPTDANNGFQGDGNGCGNGCATDAATDANNGFGNGFGDGWNNGFNNGCGGRGG